jgi:hypothetical protein
MSAKATFWAWQQRVKSSHKLVLLALANCHNESTNQCNPSISFIADSTGMNRKTVMNSLAELEKNGLIILVKKYGSSNHYKLKTSTNLGTGSHKESSTKNGTGGDGESGTNLGTSTKNGTSTNLGTRPVPKTVLQPVPNLGHEPKRESKKNLKGGAGGKFSMDLDWSPEPGFWEANKLRSGCPDFAPDQLHEFCLFWNGENIQQTESQWQGKLIRRLKQEQFKTRGQSHATNQSQRPGTASPKPSLVERVEANVRQRQQARTEGAGRVIDGEVVDENGEPVRV